MPPLPPEYELSPLPQAQNQTSGGRWAFAVKWFVIQGLVNLLIVWWLPEGTLFPFNASERYAARTFEYSGARGPQSTLAYRMMRPALFASRSPLLVFLHGAGERGLDNLSQLKYLPEQMATSKMRQRYPCFLLAPQISTNSAWVLDDQMEMVIGLIEQMLRDEPAIDRSRVYLTGLSMGGSGVWRLAAKRPDLFAAVVPVCGAGDPHQAAALRPVPVWAVHGEADNVIPVRHSREMVSAIRLHGGQPRFSELPGVGHNSWMFAYDESNGILKWMFEQARLTRPALPAEAVH